MSKIEIDVDKLSKCCAYIESSRWSEHEKIIRMLSNHVVAMNNGRIGYKTSDILRQSLAVIKAYNKIKYEENPKTYTIDPSDILSGIKKMTDDYVKPDVIFAKLKTLKNGRKNTFNADYFKQAEKIKKNFDERMEFNVKFTDEKMASKTEAFNVNAGIAQNTGLDYGIITNSALDMAVYNTADEITRERNLADTMAEYIVGIAASILAELETIEHEYRRRADEFIELTEKYLEDLLITTEKGKNEFYNAAMAKMNTDQISDCKEAIRMLEKISDWKDSKEQIEQFKDKIQCIEKKIKEEEAAKKAEEEEEKKEFMKKVGIIIAIFVIILILAEMAPSF